MVYVLIPAHNNKKEVLALLSCLYQQTYRDIEVILVDDNSADNTDQEVSASFPDTVILKGNGNLWWTGANVMGVDYILREAKDDDFILLLNNDLTIKNDYIETLINACVCNNRAITGSVLIDTDNRDSIESGVRLGNGLELIVNRDRDLILNNDFDLDVDVLPGRGTLIPVEVFKRIGNFNQKKLPHYGADYEFTIRAKRAGYKLIVSNKAIVFGMLGITGIESPDNKFISVKECFLLLFSKKSKTNLTYYLNYVWLCSDKKYRIKNLLRNAKGILSGTIGKTVIGYPFRVMSLVYTKIVRFLFQGYPLRPLDIENFRLNKEELLQDKFLLEQNLGGGNVYYYINTDACVSLENLPPEERAGRSRLKRHSFSYLHKFAILFEKFNILIRKYPIK